MALRLTDKDVVYMSTYLSRSGRTLSIRPTSGVSQADCVMVNVENIAYPQGYLSTSPVMKNTGIHLYE
jgi:hypothetical protein